MDALECRARRCTAVCVQRRSRSRSFSLTFKHHNVSTNYDLQEQLPRLASGVSTIFRSSFPGPSASHSQQRRRPRCRVYRGHVQGDGRSACGVGDCGVLSLLEPLLCGDESCRRGARSRHRRAVQRSHCNQPTPTVSDESASVDGQYPQLRLHLSMNCGVLHLVILWMSVVTSSLQNPASLSTHGSGGVDGDGGGIGFGGGEGEGRK